MIALDSSVVIAALNARHPDHASARPFLAQEPTLPAHAAIEAYSTLTRLPEPHRLDGRSVVEALDRIFGRRILPSPPPRAVVSWLRQMASEGVVGGAIYDALIAETARVAGASLVTADARAADTYRRVGVDVRLLG